MMPIRIDNRREFFWDDFLIAQTNARIVQHSPVYRGDVFSCDRPWEGSGCSYFVVVEDNGLFRMYYRGSRLTNADGTEFCNNLPGFWCYAESRDGIHWDRPVLNMCEFEGSTDNNIILNDRFYDNFYVFIDKRPGCPAGERYKGLRGSGGGNEPYGLHSYTSADGIHFTYCGLVTNKGKFDSMNTVFWDTEAGEYRCYLRDFHDVPGDDLNSGIRDIRVSTSKDFVTWTIPERITFAPNKEDIPLYTNQIQPYYRGEHVRIGFPTRYIHREWSPSFDHLPAPEHRKNRMAFSPRFGTALSDCVIMTSRDGKYFDRRDEAFMTPGPEDNCNWAYGNCFPAYGMIEVDAPIPGSEKEIALFAIRNSWVRPIVLERWGIRRDGFFSLASTYKPCFLRTKPFIFKGCRLTVNFSTSAAGGMVLTLVTADGRQYESCELFGDSTCRVVDFAGLPDLSTLAGQPVTLEAVMRDSHLYSMQFKS